MARTKIYGLVGFPLGHSFSRNFFTRKFKAEYIDAEYRNFEIDDIDKVRDVITDPSICGLNVTIPYKKAIIPYLDKLDQKAEDIGSVNVIKLNREGDMTVACGYNTDVIGFCDSIRPHLSAKHDKALVLGTGGASKAVAYGLKEMGIAVQLVSRSRGDGLLTYDDLTDDIVCDHKVIVNATPLGMYPKVEEFPPIPYEGITSDHVCFDLTYNPSETAFLKKSAKLGAVTINGLEMLHGQAIAAWHIWNE